MGLGRGISEDLKGKMNDIINAIIEEQRRNRCKISGRVQNALSKSNKAAALARSKERKAYRESAAFVRPRISFVLYRLRLLDKDNASGSIKDLLDGIKGTGLIVDDNSEDIDLQETLQVRVKTKQEERTEIVVKYPWGNKA